MEESHEPATCEGWKRWLCVIKDILPTLPKEGGTNKIHLPFGE